MLERGVIVSYETIRRRCAKFGQTYANALRRCRQRFRGGARTLLLRGDEPPFALRAHEAIDAKRRIAAEVASLITDGETVLLDSGTTCLEVARLLHGRQVTVMPLSLQAIDILSDTPEPTSLLIPGAGPAPAREPSPDPSPSPPCRRCASTPPSWPASA